MSRLGGMDADDQTDDAGSRWERLRDEGIPTERLCLTALRPEDADEMADGLDDVRLHEFVGGHPLRLDELRERYRRLAAGSSDPDEVWLNWTVRRLADALPVGALQATVVRQGNGWTATVAWVVVVAWQRRGYGSEAVRALVEWLQGHGAAIVLANIHPDHRASAAVAARAGLRPTQEEAGGERVWRATV